MMTHNIKFRKNYKLTVVGTIMYYYVLLGSGSMTY